jgi:hypothetical protein
MGHESGEFAITLVAKRGATVLGQSGIGAGGKSHTISTVLPAGDYYLTT